MSLARATRSSVGLPFSAAFIPLSSMNGVTDAVKRWRVAGAQREPLFADAMAFDRSFV